MQKDGGVFTVPCSLNGVSLKFIFDTGASDVSISLTEANFLFKNGYLTNNDIIGKAKFSDATGNISVGTLINIRKLVFSGIELNNVEASVVNSINAPLLLGQTAMSKLGKFQFDPATGILTILGKSNTQSIKSGNKEVANTTTNTTNNNNNEYYKSIDEYTDRINKNPKDDNAYLCRGITKHNLKDYSGALIDFNFAIEINPEEGYNYNSRASVRELLSDNDGAKEDYYKAVFLYKKQINLNPNYADNYFRLGLAQCGVADWKAAIISFTQAIDMNWISIESAYVWRGTSYQKLDLISEACSDWYIARTKYNYNVDYYINTYCK
jgi:clan AA aspartic protease (TIGR02281 family)